MPRPELTEAVIHNESGGDPNAVSSKGAVGLMQIMPATARAYGVDPSTLKDPVVNRNLGNRILDDFIKAQRGDERRALIDYNQGPGRVGLAPGVEDYADRVLTRANANRPVRAPNPPALNPAADDQYVATQSARADIQAKQQFIGMAEAGTPQEKAAMLGEYGLDAGRYAQLKMIAQYPLSKEDHEALEAQREQIEGKAPEISGQGVVDTASEALVGKPVAKATGSPMAGTIAQVITDVLAGVAMGKGIGGLSSAIRGAIGGAAEGGEGAAAASGLDIRADTPTAQNFEKIVQHPEATAELKNAVQELKPAVRDPETGQVYTAPGATGHGQVFDTLPLHVAEKEKLDTGFVGANGEYMTRQEAQDHLIETQTKAAAAGAQAPRPSAAAGGISSPESSPKAAAAPAAEVHSDVAALQEAGKNPMTREEMGKIEVAGEEGHQLPKTPLSYQDLVRAQAYTGQVADRVVSAQKMFLQDGSDENKTALDGAKAELEEIAPQMKAIWHQAGLTLQKVGATDPSSAQIRAVFAAMQENADAPTRMASALANLPSVAEREKLIESAASMNGDSWTWPGALYKLYVNSILSLNSAAKKAISDTAMVLYQVPARGLAELGSRAAEIATGSESGTMGVLPGETHAIVRGMMDSWGDALKIGLKSAAEGRPMFGGDVGFMDKGVYSNSLMAGSGFENTAWGRALEYYGHLVSIPGRSIIGIDQFADVMHTNMELYTLAQRQGMIEAAGEGLSGAERSARAAELAAGYLEKTPGWMNDQAMQASKVNRFQEDLDGPVLGRANALRQATYLTRSLVPFFKTATNITIQGIRNSPLAPLSGVWRNEIAGGGPEAAIAASKTALGSALFAYLTDHALKGNITGGVPANLKGTQKDDWLADHQQYSIRKADGGWISASVEPFSWIMGMAADMAPAWAYLSNAEADHAAGVMAHAFVNELNRQPLWGVVHQTVQALDDLERGRVSGLGSIGQIGTRMAAGLIPATLADVGGAIDPIRRHTEDFVSELRNRIPWLKKDGLPTLDSFGQPSIVPPGFMWNEFPAYATTAQKKADPVIDEMDRLSGSVGFQVPQVPKSIGPHTGDPDNLDNPQEAMYGARLTPAEQNRWLELRGDPAKSGDPELKGFPKLYDAVAKRMKDPDYLNESDAARASDLHRIFTGYEHMAHDKLIEENTSISGRLVAAYAGRAAQRVAPRSAQANLGAP